MSLIEEQLNIIDNVNERVDDIEIYKNFYENPKLTKAQQKYNKGFLIEVFKNRMLYCNPKEYEEYIKIFVKLFILNNDIEISETVNSSEYGYGHNIRDKLTNIVLCKIFNDDCTDIESDDKTDDNELRIDYEMDFYNDGVLRDNSFILRISKLDELKNNKILTLKNKNNYYSFTRENITEMLENDDVELLIKILSQPSQKMSKRFHVYSYNNERERCINLIELIIVYSAIKCFKYIILNKYLDTYLEDIGNEKSVTRSIIVSNNCEMLHLFENNYKSYFHLYEIMDRAIYYHRNDFIFYILNKCEDQQEIHDRYWIMDMFDYCLSSYNYKALLILLDETGEQVTITTAVMKRNNSYSSDYDFRSKLKYVVPISVYVLDNYNFSLFTDWSYIVELLFNGTLELDFIKRVLYSVEIKDMKTLEYNGNPPDSFIRAFSTCIINDVPDDYIKLLKIVYYGKEFLTINELNNIKLSVILNKILNRKPKIKQINYNKFINHIVPEIVYYDPYRLSDILNIRNRTKNYLVKGLDELVKEYVKRIII